MNTGKTVCIGVMAALSLAGTAAADIVMFSDDFNSETLALNYTGFANWDVSDGTVDLIGAPSFFDLIPGHGRYVDLDGSTGNAGTITTKPSLGWTFVLGQRYSLDFDLAGNQRGGAADSVVLSVNVGNLGPVTIPSNSSMPLTHFHYEWIGNGSTGGISFAAAGGDNIGQLLDNVQLTQLVPLPPAAWAGIGSLACVAGFGAIRRRKHATV